MCAKQQAVIGCENEHGISHLSSDDKFSRGNWMKIVACEAECMEANAKSGQLNDAYVSGGCRIVKPDNALLIISSYVGPSQESHIHGDEWIVAQHFVLEGGVVRVLCAGTQAKIFADMEIAKYGRFNGIDDRSIRHLELSGWTLLSRFHFTGLMQKPQGKSSISRVLYPGTGDERAGVRWP